MLNVSPAWRAVITAAVVCVALAVGITCSYVLALHALDRSQRLWCADLSVSIAHPAERSDPAAMARIRADQLRLFHQYGC